MPRGESRPIAAALAARNKTAVTRLIRWAVRFYNSDALFVVLTPSERRRWDDELAAILNTLNVRFDGRGGSSANQKEMGRRAKGKARIPDANLEFVDLNEV